MASSAKRKRGKEYYLDCSTCGDLQDAYTNQAQAKWAIDRHQISYLAQVVKGTDPSGQNARHRVTVRLRRDD